MAANGFLRAAYSELLGGNYFTVELHRKVHERPVRSHCVPSADVRLANTGVRLNTGTVGVLRTSVEGTGVFACCLYFLRTLRVFAWRLRVVSHCVTKSLSVQLSRCIRLNHEWYISILPCTASSCCDFTETERAVAAGGGLYALLYAHAHARKPTSMFCVICSCRARASVEFRYFSTT